MYVDRAVFADVAKFLRDAQQFTMLCDITAVDHLLDGSRSVPEGVTAERFEVVANYLSHTRNRRVRVICQVPAQDPTVPSLTGVYRGANFPERETFDLFGITFSGHPDLTRILMPDDWQGHPLERTIRPRGYPSRSRETRARDELPATPKKNGSSGRPTRARRSCAGRLARSCSPVAGCGRRTSSATR